MHKLFIDFFILMQISTLLFSMKVANLSVCETGVLIINEISMMSAQLLEVVDRICRESSCSPEHQALPKDVLLLGDLYQLSAVITCVSQTQIYSSQLWALFTPLFLQENCRQSEDLPFQQMLNRLREGNITNSDIAALETRTCQKGTSSLTVNSHIIDLLRMH